MCRVKENHNGVCVETGQQLLGGGCYGNDINSLMLA